MKSFGSSYGTPGWQRAQANKGRGGFSETGAPRYGEKGVGDDSLDHIDPIYDDDGMQVPATSPRRRRRAAGAAKRRMPLTIEGELVAKSTGTVSDLRRRRPRVSPEVRQRQRGGGRRQQADDRV